MGFNDYFENRQHGNHRSRQYDDDHRHDHDSRHGNYEYGNQLQLSNFIQTLKGNKKLKLFLIVSSIIVLAIVIMLIIALLPLIMKLFHYITQNGLKGILDNLWKETGK